MSIKRIIVALLLGGRIVNLEDHCSSAVRGPNCQSRGSGTESIYCRFETGAIKFTSHCISDATLKCLVPMPGEVRYHTREVNM